MISDRASLAKQFSLRVVAEALFHNAPISRADLARATGLSKQTTSSVISTLETAGWVKSVGVATGGVGRNAVTYEVVGDVAYSVGVDLGGSKITAAIADVRGDIVAEATEATDPRGGVHVLEQIHALSSRLARARRIDAARLKSIVVGTPGVVDPLSGAVSLAPNIRGLADISVTRLLSERFGREVALENDVNLAMLGEAWQGSAQGCQNAGFIALGSGVGLGLIINGKLVRGATGAAGEIAYLPVGADISSPEAMAVGAFELEVGSAGILRRYRAVSAKPVDSVRDIFVLLEEGDRDASDVLDATARAIARAIMAVQAIVDAELIVLGGSIGVRPELIERVQKQVASVFARSAPIRGSMLGPRAGLIGAVSLAVHRLHNDQFGMSGLPSELTLPTPTFARAAQ